MNFSLGVLKNLEIKPDCFKKSPDLGIKYRTWQQCPVQYLKPPGDLKTETAETEGPGGGLQMKISTPLLGRRVTECCSY